jgi:hypothetical protein
MPIGTNRHPKSEGSFLLMMSLRETVGAETASAMLGSAPDFRWKGYGMMASGAALLAISLRGTLPPSSAISVGDSNKSSDYATS